MRRDRAAYLLFVVAGFAQLGVLVLIGETRIYKGGLLVPILLVAWLGRRSRAAWWLFVIGNLWLLLATVALLLAGSTQSSITGPRGTRVIESGPPGGGVMWGDVIALGLGSSVLLAILFSRSMRTWVRLRRPSQAIPTAPLLG